MTSKTVEVAWPERNEQDLRRMADQLAADGFTDAAEAYRGRIPGAARAYTAAERALSHLNDLDSAAARAARENQDEDFGPGQIGADHSIERATALASWLVRQGWTPPTSLPGLVVREAGE
ncbi:hypothetical protein BJD60_gp43 [Gordonia phage Schnabeltier]|uniref:Uncharacterized protein n=1 Tax=Gordonia phage Schnabeltier TaxID=1821561 RepID=A0A142KA31_9CAUD|nr:hypothetical protein BJD60_gp43 [Gordonia phage Schnabeltier]AMS02964.1 hypothetical protein SEA_SCHNABELTIER_43 [Gordonia phage Schnabeltier]